VDFNTERAEEHGEERKRVRGGPGLKPDFFPRDLFAALESAAPLTEVRGFLHEERGFSHEERAQPACGRQACCAPTWRGLKLV
jgi:hypothetical protein